MKFDDIVAQLGDFGTYQKRQYFLLCLPNVSIAIQMFITFFIMDTPAHRCAIPGLDNDTYAVQDDTHWRLINQTIPYAYGDDEDVYEKCTIYNDGHDPGGNRSDTAACSSWVYDTSVYQSTFVSQINLVCTRRWSRAHAQMIYFVGVLIGGFVISTISDILGRKNALILSIVLLLTSSVSLAWAPNFAAFASLRFIIGMANLGVFMTTIVMGIELVAVASFTGIALDLFVCCGCRARRATVGTVYEQCVELVGPQWRVFTGIVLDLFFAAGMIILVGLAYCLRSWSYLQLVAAIPSIIFLSYIWLIPESARWLIQKKRFEEANKILKKVARVNKAEITSAIFEDHYVGETHKEENILTVFGSKTLAIRFGVLLLNWLTIGMCYFGLSMNSGNLGGNIYVNFLISGLVEIPAYLLCMIFMNKIDRRWFYSSNMIICGIFCLGTIFTILYAPANLQWLTIVLANLGKLAVSVAFAVIFVYTTEMFPTSIRNAALGVTSMGARIGGMSAPYIADAGVIIGGNFGKALPLLIFGVGTIVAGTIALILPETRNITLPETIEEAENMGRRKPDKAKKRFIRVDIPLADRPLNQHLFLEDF